MRRPAHLLVPLACATIAAGCGNERQSPPDLTAVRQPGKTKAVSYPRVGMRFRAPGNWELRDREAPGVFTLSSGAGFVSGFAYRRPEPLPDTDADLEAARRRLIGEVRERDEKFDLAGSRKVEVDGARAIELRGRQTISNRPLETRSVHVFRGSVEYVLEALAPPADFTLVDRRVLRPLLRSLELSGRIRRRR